VEEGQVASDHDRLVILSSLVYSGGDERGFETIWDREISISINGALATPGYLLALLREFWHAPGGFTEIAHAKQVRRTNWTGILYWIKNKGPQIDSHILNTRSFWFLFRGVQVHPLVMNCCYPLRVCYKPGRQQWRKKLLRMFGPELIRINSNRAKHGFKKPCEAVFYRRQPWNFENATSVARRTVHFRGFWAIFLVAQLPPKRCVLIHKNALASYQRFSHSVEPHALTCLFKQSNLSAWWYSNL